MYAASSRENTATCSSQYDDFLTSSAVKALKVLNIQTFNYIVHKLALKPDNVQFGFKDHMCAVKSSGIHAEPAIVAYLSVLDIHHLRPGLK